MSELSDAFVMLPGGFGTYEEFMESVTWAQLGIHDKRCGILNVDGFFDHLLAFLGHAVDQGFIRAATGRGPGDLRRCRCACSTRSWDRPASGGGAVDAVRGACSLPDDAGAQEAEARAARHAVRRRRPSRRTALATEGTASRRRWPSPGGRACTRGPRSNPSSRRPTYRHAAQHLVLQLGGDDRPVALDEPRGAGDDPPLGPLDVHLQKPDRTSTRSSRLKVGTTTPGWARRSLSSIRPPLDPTWVE